MASWTIEFSKVAQRDLRKLDQRIAARIVHFLDDRIAGRYDPLSVGEALAGPNLRRLWKYRMGDRRIIAGIED